MLFTWRANGPRSRNPLQGAMTAGLAKLHLQIKPVKPFIFDSARLFKIFLHFIWVPVSLTSAHTRLNGICIAGFPSPQLLHPKATLRAGRKEHNAGLCTAATHNIVSIQLIRTRSGESDSHQVLVRFIPTRRCGMGTPSPAPASPSETSLPQLNTKQFESSSAQDDTVSGTGFLVSHGALLSPDLTMFQSSRQTCLHHNRSLPSPSRTFVDTFVNRFSHHS